MSVTRGVSSSGSNSYPETDRWFASEGKWPDKLLGKVRLDYFAVRYYGSLLGRFTSPYSNNSQTWNRYAYGLNNPLRVVDPTGPL